MGIIRNIVARAALRFGLPVFYERRMFNTMGGEAKVDTDFALKISTVWACVDLLSGAMSTLPLHVKERTDSGRRAADEAESEDERGGFPAGDDGVGVS